jgi:N-acetylmuramoyl-L-alanine amidase
VPKGPTTHVVAAGEQLAGIAASYGFGDPQKIWDHGNNSALRSRRSDPHLLAAGDQLYIPAPEPAELSCSTGKRHRLTANVPPVQLKLELRGEGRQPLANQTYCIVFEVQGGEHTVDGTTGGGGELSAELPASCTRARLQLPDLGVDYELAIGGLDPIDDEGTRITGAQARLNNLGFGCGAVDGDHGPHTREAVCAFQKQVMQRPDADGELDDATWARLVDEHGS